MCKITGIIPISPVKRSEGGRLETTSSFEPLLATAYCAGWMDHWAESVKMQLAGRFNSGYKNKSLGQIQIIQLPVLLLPVAGSGSGGGVLCPHAHMVYIPSPTPLDTDVAV